MQSKTQATTGKLRTVARFSVSGVAVVADAAVGAVGVVTLGVGVTVRLTCCTFIDIYSEEKSGN